MKLIMSDRPVFIEPSPDSSVRYFDLSTMKIANCVGCFGCWTKTPGKCVIRDDATKVYPVIAQSDEVIYVSKIKYGGYDTVMKKMLERAIPVQQAFIRIHNGETHHIQRAVTPKKATIIAYGDDISDEEKDIFRELVSRNAQNMNFSSHEIIFTTRTEVDAEVRKAMELWEK